MTDRSIARRYGRAVLDVAIQEADPEAVQQQLDDMAELIGGHDELRRALTNPAVPTPRKRAAVAALLERVSAVSTVSPVVSKLLLLLSERDRLGLLDELRRGVRRVPACTSADRSGRSDNGRVALARTSGRDRPRIVEGHGKTDDAGDDGGCVDSRRGRGAHRECRV